MELDDIRKRKRVLENQIMACIEEFERDTKCRVTDLNCVRERLMTESHSHVVSVEAEIKL